ncbi:entericidin A/B family lipoprotein [Sulfitobacter sp. LCG007]
MTRIAILVATLFALTACETVKGAGRDVENAGEALQTESAEAQAQM